MTGLKRFSAILLISLIKRILQGFFARQNISENLTFIHCIYSADIQFPPWYHIPEAPVFPELSGS